MIHDKALDELCVHCRFVHFHDFDHVQIDLPPLPDRQHCVDNRFRQFSDSSASNLVLSDVRATWRSTSRVMSIFWATLEHFLCLFRRLRTLFISPKVVIFYSRTVRYKNIGSTRISKISIEPKIRTSPPTKTMTSLFRQLPVCVVRLPVLWILDSMKFLPILVLCSFLE